MWVLTEDMLSAGIWTQQVGFMNDFHHVWLSRVSDMLLWGGF